MSFEKGNIAAGRQLEQVEFPSGEYDLRNPEQLQAYKQAVVEPYNTLLHNTEGISPMIYLRQGKLDERTRAAFANIAMMRLRMIHWKQAIAKFEANPNDNEVLKKVREYEGALHDLYEPINVALLAKHIEVTTAPVETSAAPVTSPLVLTDAMQVKPLKDMEMQPLVLTDDMRVETEPVAETVATPMVESAEPKLSIREKLQAWLKNRTPIQLGAITGAVLAVLPQIANQYNETMAPHRPIVVESTITGIGQSATWGTATELPPVVPTMVEEPAVSQTAPDLLPITPVAEAAVVAPHPPAPVRLEVTSVTMPEEPRTEVVLPNVEMSEVAPVVPSVPEPLAPVAAAETLPSLEAESVYQYEIKVGGPYLETLADRVLEADPSVSLPPLILEACRHKARTDFIADPESLRAAGVVMDNYGNYFAGPVNLVGLRDLFESYCTESARLLKQPHTLVVEAGGNLTEAVLKSFAKDLVVVPESIRADIAAEALLAYTKKDTEALSAMRTPDGIDHINVSTIVVLEGLVPYLNEAIKNHVYEQIGNGNTAPHEVVEQATTETVAAAAPEVTPESYPGGVLAYSQAYNSRLAKLGIKTSVPSFFDPRFDAGKDNRTLLTLSVGQLDTIMNQHPPAKILEELATLGVDGETANRVYALVREARAKQYIPAKLDLSLSVEDMVKAVVLQESRQS